MALQPPTSLAQLARQAASKAAVPALQTAAVGLGLGLAARDASALYSQRSVMASLYQEESVFPADLIQSNRDFYMSFKFQKYEKRAINNSPFLRSTGTVRLPIPNNLKDNMNVSYGTPSLGPTVGAALENILANPPADNSIEAVGSTLVGSGSAALTGAAASLVNNSAAGQAASSYFGIAVNPYQTVLFEKPDFKKHTFSWKLIPKNEQESATIRNIVRTFQYHMSPGVGDNSVNAPGLFFSYPSMVVISLFPSSEFLYRFKPCVLQSVNVDYAPGSSPSFYKRTSGAPAAVNITLSLTEIEYWTNKDFLGSQTFSDASATLNQLRVDQRNNAAVELAQQRAIAEQQAP
jgi:hypothetical protein